MHKSIAEKFIEAYCKRYEEIVVFAADETDDKGTQGPIVDKPQFENVIKFIEEAKEVGTLKLGGKRRGNKGYFVEPVCFALSTL